MKTLHLPREFFNPDDPHPILRRKVGREFAITHDTSIQTITDQVHARPDIDAYGLAIWNLPDAHHRYTNPILTMESDDTDISPNLHRKIARWVGGQPHRRYRRQVQIVWSGNTSHHIHFRIHRRNLLASEAKTIQRFITDQMETLVRDRCHLPDFKFDSRVKNRLGLVRPGNGTRVQIGKARPKKAGEKTKYDGVRVDRLQRIIRYWDSDFDDPDTIFPITPDLTRALGAPAARQARRRARATDSPSPQPSDQDLTAYADHVRAEDGAQLALNVG